MGNGRSRCRQQQVQRKPAPPRRSNVAKATPTPTPKPIPRKGLAEVSVIMQSGCKLHTYVAFQCTRVEPGVKNGTLGWPHLKITMPFSIAKPPVISKVSTVPVTSLDKLQIGAEIGIPNSFRGVKYHHVGVFLGKGKVIHAYASTWEGMVRFLKSEPSALIRIVTVEEFLKGRPVTDLVQICYPSSVKKRTAAEITAIAAKLNGNRYSFSPRYHNCQHLSHFIACGVAFSFEACRCDDPRLQTIAAIFERIG